MCKITCQDLVLSGRPAEAVIEMCKHLSEIEPTIIDKNSVYRANIRVPTNLEKYRHWCSLFPELCNFSKIKDLNEEDFLSARLFIAKASRLREDVICEP